VIKLRSKTFFIFVSILFFAVSSPAIAIKKQNQKQVNAPQVVAMQKVIVVTMRAKNGDNVVYEMTDSTKGGEQPDGLIDFANFIKVFRAHDTSTGSQIARGTKYPITVKIIYFRPGDEISNSFPIMTNEEWFGGFHARIAKCIDANQRIVPPIDGQWETYTVTSKFMRQLQQLYERYK
jgi:hypothetical protein